VGNAKRHAERELREAGKTITAQNPIAVYLPFNDQQVAEKKTGSNRERGEPPLPEPSVGAEQEWENGVKLDEHRKIPPR
jgi:hypothetical protein